MADAALLFLDTNVVMYAVGKEHPLKVSCIAALRAVEVGDLRVVTSVEVLQEIVHRYQGAGRLDLAQRVIEDLKVLCETILPIDLADLEASLTLLQNHPTITARDALHAAVMLHHGIRQILSTDRHFDEIVEIRRLDPAAAGS